MLKKEEICLQKHGVKYPLQSEEIKEKLRNTNLKIYGAENPMQNESVREKAKSTNQEIYGVDNVFKSEEIKNKIKQAFLKKYGVDNPAKVEEFKEKIKQTCIERYGVDHFSKTNLYNEIIKNTSIEKYGVEHMLKSPEIINKIINIWMEKYGVDNPAKSPEIKQKFVDTCREKYGCDNPMQVNKIKSLSQQTCIDKYGKFPVGNYGKTQQNLQNWLNSFGFDFKSGNFILNDSKEIDLYDKNKKIACEYCGNFWHTEMSPEPRGKYYHYDKYKQCLDMGIKLITIFSDEWEYRQNQCKSRLKSILGIYDLKLFARNCDFKFIDKKEFMVFCDSYHIQKPCNGGISFGGLFYNNELVGAMSIGRHNRNNKQLVLDRLCFKDGVQVIGGASKLFKNLNIKENIVTFSDNRWSNGKVYESIGFMLVKELRPDYSYVNMKNPKLRFSKQSQKDNKDGIPEYEWCLKNNLARIWDCGKKKWEYSPN